MNTIQKAAAMLLVASTFAACNGSAKDGGGGSSDSTASVSSSTPTDTLANKNSAQSKADSMMKNAPDTVKAK